jgi:hypothetical protein
MIAILTRTVGVYYDSVRLYFLNNAATVVGALPAATGPVQLTEAGEQLGLVVFNPAEEVAPEIPDEAEAHIILTSEATEYGADPVGARAEVSGIENLEATEDVRRKVEEQTKIVGQAQAIAAEAASRESRRMITRAQVAEIMAEEQRKVAEAAAAAENSRLRYLGRKAKKIINILSPYFTELFKNMLVHTGMHSGGGKNNYSYLFFLNYLTTLMNGIMGFDAGEVTDYVFYEKLAIMIISCIKPYSNENNYDELLSVAYNKLPEGDWELKNISSSMKRCIEHVASDTALHSLNMRDGDIPGVSRAETFLLESSDVETKIDTLRKSFSKMKFIERKLHLIKTIGTIIYSLKPPRDTHKIDFSKIKLTTGHHLFSSKKSEHLPTFKLMKAKSGGYKTRYNKRKIYKGRKGSPKRKTLRKTRKHK